MSWIYRQVIRPRLFAEDSEAIHNTTLEGLSRASHHALPREVLRFFYEAPSLASTAFGLTFPNPVGLAAGMDKQAAAVPIWECLGFGFAELGGVTRHAQPGNPSPRMFRVPQDQALINRMGFNNPGAEALAHRLREWQQKRLWPSHPIGMNLGKSKITPLEEAAEDYATSFKLLKPFADFFVVNVSSPNTPGLRALQDADSLVKILAAIEVHNRDLQLGPRRPVLVKVAPDLSDEALDELAELAMSERLAGIVATNTTIARPAWTFSSTYQETGGLSGQPLKARSTQVVRRLYRKTGGRLPIIGVGGIASARDAWEKITAGASLVQIYTGLVYEGPGLVKSIVAGLRRYLEQSGFGELSDAVGIYSDQVSFRERGNV
jgi:dihydroorotate dehydrogenase